MDANQQQQIEAYLSGEMSPEELSRFESLLEVNPELQQQVNFQTEVIQGIGQYRKTQLKARLEAIDPSPVWWTIAHLSPVGQFIGGATIIGALGFGIYFTSDQLQNPSSSTAIEVVAPSPPTIEMELPNISPLPFKEVKTDEFSEAKNRNQVAEAHVTDELSDGEEDVFTPVVSVPEVGDIEAEKEFLPNDLPTPDETFATGTQSSENPVEVEVVSDRGSKIKYEYYAGKLYLYGQFRDEPYQILEINSAVGRKIYLYHLNVFYQINPVDKPTDLQRIEDEDLIKELDILRKSK